MHSVDLLLDNPSGRNKAGKIIFFAPLVILIVFVILKIWFTDLYWFLNQEDGPVKICQSLICFIASFTAAFVALGFMKKKQWFLGVVYSLLSLGLFFIAGEEVGWGSRIIGFSISDYLQLNNVQRELSFHNMHYARWYVNEAYVVVGFFCAFLWLILPKKIKNIDTTASGFLVPQKHLVFYFAPVFILYAYFCYFSTILAHATSTPFFFLGFTPGTYLIHFIDQEPVELLLAAGFLVFVVCAKLQQSREPSLDNRTAMRLAVHLFAFMLVVAVPFHFGHTILQKRLYPYDEIELGKLLFKNNQYDEAWKHYKIAMAMDPRNPHIYINLGVLSAAEGKAEDAGQYFKRAVELNPKDAYARYDQGLLFYNQNKLPQAIENYQAALSLQPRFYLARRGIGEVFLKQGDFDSALKHFLLAAKGYSKDIVLYTKIADIFMLRKEYAKAINFYEKAAWLNPDFATHYNLGCGYLALGNFNKAQDHLLASINLNPHNAYAYNNLGIAYMRQGNFVESHKSYLKALSMNAGIADFHFNLGVLLLAEQKAEEAKREFLATLQIDPSHEKAQKFLRDIQTNTGDQKKK